VEKKKPHYHLEDIRCAVRAGRIRITTTAAIGAHALGMLDDDIWNVLLALTPADFYKSMTTYADHRAWQDVYRTRCKDRVLYVKIQKVTDAYWVISFKEK